MQALKQIYRELRKNKQYEPFTYETDAELMQYLLNRKREKLIEFEAMFHRKIFIVPASHSLCSFC